MPFCSVTKSHIPTIKIPFQSLKWREKRCSYDKFHSITLSSFANAIAKFRLFIQIYIEKKLNEMILKEH